MGKKPTLSPSKFETYLRCPVKYNLTYLDPRGRRFFRSRAEFTFGSVLHRALQKFHEEGGAQVVSQEALVASFQASWRTEGFESDERAEEHRQLGLTLLTAYHEAHREAEPTKTLLTEKQLRLDLGEFVLIGRIDRIDERSNGAIEVIDYKSGRDDVSDDEVREDFSMGCYALLAQAAYPDRPILTSIVALRSGNKGTAPRTPEEIDAIRQDVIALGCEILTMDFEALRPIFKPRRCPYCEFSPICRTDADFSAQFRAQERD